MPTQTKAYLVDHRHNSRVERQTLIAQTYPRLRDALTGLRQRLESASGAT